MGPERAPRSRILSVILALVWALAALPPAAASRSALTGTGPSPRPNILLIVTDDQAWSTFSRSLMPRLFADVVDRGVLFERGYVGTSLCCPSRAQMLTGLTSEHTGVDENDIVLERPTIVQTLHAHGYRTLLAGKYLNSQGCSPLPEFDRWACLAAYPSTYSLTDPLLNIDGSWIRRQGFQTDVLAEEFASFVEETPEDRPFFALVAPTSPHLPGNDHRYDSMPVTPPRPPSYDQEMRTENTPLFLRKPNLHSSQISAWDEHYRTMARAVRSLDDSVGTMLDALGSRADDTLVAFISDNGYLYGEHRRTGKQVLYEESVRVPMAVRFPAMLSPDRAFASEALVANIDLAPTFADVAGFDWGVDGRSLVPLLDGSSHTIRRALLLERCRGLTGERSPCTGLEYTGSQTRVPISTAVVTATHKLIRNFDGQRQLFDLAADPFEMVNLAGRSSAADVEEDLDDMLGNLLTPEAIDTTIVEGPTGDVSERAVTFRAFTQSRFATFRCRLWRDGVKGSWRPCSGEEAVVGGLRDGDYHFQIAATDERGNVDETPASRAFTVTSSGPRVELTGTAPTITTKHQLSFELDGDSSRLRFECRLSAWGSNASWSPCSAKSGVEYGGLEDGLWNFEVRATDRETGEVSDPPAARLTRIDRVGPVMRWSAHPWSVTNATGAVFRFVGDEQPVRPLKCRLDGDVRACGATTLRLSNLRAGTHRVSVIAEDALGNRNATGFSWTVELTRPVASIVEKPSRVTSAHHATFEVASNEEGPGFVCAFDGGLRMPCQPRDTWFGFEEGSHTIEVWAMDRALNVSSEPAVYTWTVD